jgi:citrate synthase
MFYPCSSLDPAEGIRFQGLSIPEMQEQLPKIGNQPIPEAVYWLLLTGEIPSQTELASLQQTLTTDNELSERTVSLIKQNAKIHHPMTVLSMAVMDLQKDSLFYDRYSQGKFPKSEYWNVAFDDTINCLKVLPRIAALIYTEKYDK